MDERYRINEPEVVTETLDGEALIVHLGTGCYFSCRGTAEIVWRQLVAGSTLAETAAALAQRFEATNELIAEGVTSFARTAIDEGLLVADASITRSSDGDNGGMSAMSAYEPPEFEKYTDMQELLALDPVHDVDSAQGWPKVPESELQQAT